MLTINALILSELSSFIMLCAETALLRDVCSYAA